MYSLSEEAFKLVEAYLTELLHADVNELVWELEETRKFAYLLRQGMYIAEKLQKPALSELRTKWTIKEKGNKVIAKRKFVEAIKPIGVHKKTFPGLHTVSKVISTVIDNDHLTVLNFPDGEFNPLDIEMLQKWCRLKGWEFNEESKEIRKCHLTETETKQSENLLS